jgi:outer membrane protein assembly factor BamB
MPSQRHSSFGQIRLTRRGLLHAVLGSVVVGAFTGARYQVADAQGAVLATPTPLGPAIPPEVSAYAGDWPVPQGNLAAHRAAADSPITAATVGHLEVAWRVPLDGVSGIGAVTAIPVVVGNTVFVQDMESNVLAIDRESGALRWRHDYGAPSSGPNGVSVGYGLVFGSTGFRAEAFALDAATGDEVWRVKLSNNPNESIVMQPTVYDNVVYISTSAASYVGGARGILFALDAGTGATLWQWDTTVDNLWGSARLNAGSGLWYPPSVDERGNIYFGTANPAPWPGTEQYPNGASRPGPNLYSSSMVSLDPTTGSLRWYVQAKPHDLLDHDFQLSPILATVAINGTPRKLAIGAGKTGTMVAADADTGDVLWQTSVGEHNDYGDGALLPLGTPVAAVPGPYGGMQTPFAFADGTIFAPVSNAPTAVTATGIAPNVFDIDTADETNAAYSEMMALDAANGSVRWSTRVDAIFVAGATVANDVVFGAGLDGVVRGFATATGEQIWTFQTRAGINAPLAVAGDTIFVPAGGPLVPPDAQGSSPQAELIALRLGAAGPDATPAAGTPVSG